MGRQPRPSRALSALFDARVRVAARVIEPHDANAPPPPHLESAPPARRAQFAAGRACARAALAAAGAPASADVGVARGNVPAWPSGFVGSIAHTDWVACAAASSARDLRAIGLDIEPFVDDGAFHLLRSTVVRPDEQALVGGSRRLLTIAFSAKESFFKCVAPITGTLFDFTDVRIVAIDRRGALRLEACKALGRGVDRGFAVNGRYAVAGDNVLTAVTLAT